MPVLQLGLALLGCAAFCVYARSWRDAAHGVYDVPASFATFAFVAQLVLEAARERPAAHWVGRVLLLAAMTAVVTGREFGGWNISGHLSCVLAIALAQAADPRLPMFERALYWVPLPIVLYVRWYCFDQGNHAQTYNALIFAAAAAAPVMALARLRAGG